MKKLLTVSGSILALSLPYLALAQGANSPSACSRGIERGTIQDIICRAAGIIDLIIPILILIAVLLFVWGVIQFVINTDSETAQKKGRDKIVQGVVGLVAIFALWGLVRLVTRTFGLDVNNNYGGDLQLPRIPF